MTTKDTLLSIYHGTKSHLFPFWLYRYDKGDDKTLYIQPNEMICIQPEHNKIQFQCMKASDAKSQNKFQWPYIIRIPEKKKILECERDCQITDDKIQKIESELKNETEIRLMHEKIKEEGTLWENVYFARLNNLIPKESLNDQYAKKAFLLAEKENWINPFFDNGAGWIKKFNEELVKLKVGTIAKYIKKFQFIHQLIPENVRKSIVILIFQLIAFTFRTGIMENWKILFSPILFLSPVLYDVIKQNISTFKPITSSSSDENNITIPFETDKNIYWSGYIDVTLLYFEELNAKREIGNNVKFVHNNVIFIYCDKKDDCRQKFLDYKPLAGLESMKIFIFPITIIFKKGAHSNILMLNRAGKKPYFEYFEPHGDNFAMFSEDYKGIRKQITYTVQKIAKDFQFKEYDYYPPNSYCPRIGLQTKHFTKELFINFHGGYCAAWSVLWIEMRLRYPSIEREKLYQILMKKIDTNRDYIKYYANHIAKVLYEKISDSSKVNDKFKTEIKNAYKIRNSDTFWRMVLNYYNLPSYNKIN